jgi:integrase
MKKLIPEPDCPELQRDSDSGVWYYRKYVKGRGAFFRSTGERRSKVKAKAIGLRLFAEWMGTEEAVKKAVFLFEHVAEKYLELKQNRRKKTIISAENHVKNHLMPFFSGFPIQECADRWEEYVRDKRDKAPTRRFYNDVKHMRGIMRLAYLKGMISKPAVITNPDGKVEAGKEYTEAEVKKLLQHANKDLSLQIRMAFIMGMRRSEILKLNWNRIDFKNGIIRLTAEDTKTKEPRDIPMHTEIWAELKLRHQSCKSDFVFPSPTNPAKPIEDNKTAWQGCKVSAGVTGRFHDLRHTAVTRMLFEFNIPAAKVAAIVGMSLAVMQRYSHPKGKHLRGAMESIRGILWSENEKDNENKYVQ